MTVDGPTAGERLVLAGRVARLAAVVATERVRRPRAVSAADVPADLDAITPAWLGAVLGGTVDEVTVVGQSDGTSSRRTLQLTGTDVPSRVFAKAAPGLATRLTNGLSGVAVAEAGFYRDLRPRLTIEAPIAFHSAVDTRNHRMVHLLDDLAATRAATFCDAGETVVDRTMAEGMIDVLGALHASDAARAMVADPPSWLRTHDAWMDHQIRLADLRRAHARGLRDADVHVAEELRGRADETWAAVVRARQAHVDPPTIIHGDPHLGNWYRTGDGAMGLLDWQCTTAGHWARDVAYTIAAALRVEDRRDWDHELVRRHAAVLRDHGMAVDDDEAVLRYRQQLAGALMMWTPTFTPPPFFPEMQPRHVAATMIERITTAMVDHATLTAFD